MNRFLGILIAFVTGLPLATLRAENSLDVDRLKIDGEFSQEGAQFTLSGNIRPSAATTHKPLISSHARIHAGIDDQVVSQEIHWTFTRLQGKTNVFRLNVQGNGQIESVRGSAIESWSDLKTRNGQRFLEIRTTLMEDPPGKIDAVIETSTKVEGLPTVVSPLRFAPANAALFDGFLHTEWSSAVDVQFAEAKGLTPLVVSLDAEQRQRDSNLRFYAMVPEYAFRILPANPDRYRTVFEEYELTGSIEGDYAEFCLSGSVSVGGKNGGSLRVLGGDAALKEIEAGGHEVRYVEEKWRPYVVKQGDNLHRISRLTGASVEALMRENKLSQDTIQVGASLRAPDVSIAAGYYLDFKEPGRYPIEVTFVARVREYSGWKSIRFFTPESSMRPVLIQGLEEDTRLSVSTAVEPRRSEAGFEFHLPTTGILSMSFRKQDEESEKDLFFSATGLVHAEVSPGILRQRHGFNVDVMQGSLEALVFDMQGEGEVVRVTGGNLRSWSISSTGLNRQLIIDLTKPVTDSDNLTIHTQNHLNDFPSSFTPMRMTPAGLTRYEGYLRIVNQGAVRLRSKSVRGLSQISPERFPVTRGFPKLESGQQAFAYRFSETTYDIEMAAEEIRPEIFLSEVSIQRVGLSETVLDVEFELDIREAPIRDLELSIPNGYVVADLTIAHLVDYDVLPSEGERSRVSLSFGIPLVGRQLMRLQLEKMWPSFPELLPLDRVRVIGSKSQRGYVAVSVETGLRIPSAEVSGLTEIGLDFFPKRTEGIQLAWRYRNDDWRASVSIEQQDQSILTTSVHIASVSEGMAYGSSVITYLISGSPASVLKLKAPAELPNVEFTGRDIRGWRLVDGVYEVQMHAPVMGAYTLLCSYDYPYLAGDEGTVYLSGFQPEDSDKDQGYALAVSERQFLFETEGAEGAIKLDPTEIPSEHRLLFSAPILAAYQYLARPFELTAKLSPLVQGETIQQVVDRAEVTTDISSDGHQVTDVRYLLKSRGASHLKMTLPANVSIWEATADGSGIRPVTDGDMLLAPLPATKDPNDPIELRFKLLSSEAAGKSQLRIGLPVIQAPVLVTDWQIRPENNFQLRYQGGSVQPKQVYSEPTGFLWLSQMLFQRRSLAISTLVGGLLIFLGTLISRLATSGNRNRFDKVNLGGLILGFMGLVGGMLIVGDTVFTASGFATMPPADLSFDIAALESGAEVVITADNESKESQRVSSAAWLGILALGIWIWGYRLKEEKSRARVLTGGWLILFWGGLTMIKAPVVIVTIMAGFFFFQVLVPLFKRQLRLAPRAVATSLLVWLCLNGGSASLNARELTVSGLDDRNGLVERVEQQVSIGENQIVARVSVIWMANEGDAINLLRDPAVITKIDLDPSLLHLVDGREEGQSVVRLRAKKGQRYHLQYHYSAPIIRSQDQLGFRNPAPPGLINTLRILDASEDYSYSSEDAVSVRSVPSISDGAERDILISMKPNDLPWVRWQPKARDTSKEKTSFFAEATHLFAPTAGVVEGYHRFDIRLAQGELETVTLTVPKLMTITDVKGQHVGNWRFNPDDQRLKVDLRVRQRDTFKIGVISQVTASTLPYEVTVSLPILNEASAQNGVTGVATGNEVQVNEVRISEGVVMMNLDDFPAQVVADFASLRGEDLNLRRAYRFNESAGDYNLTVAAVVPDVRVVTRETLSVGQDRNVLAFHADVTITRAGIFALSFDLPQDYEVESISGSALSHWTEAEEEAETQRVTLHLRGRTTGKHVFDISLVGPGIEGRNQIMAPKIRLEEADKQRGQLGISPEPGVRLHLHERARVTELDPSRLGIPSSDARAFRLLDSEWFLLLDIEKVDPWVEALTFQDVWVRDGQVLTECQLQYEVKYAGIDRFMVQLPAEAESVIMDGDYLSDTIRGVEGEDGKVAWTVKLARRIMGHYSLKISYQGSFSGKTQWVRIQDVTTTSDLRRGYLVLRAGGRLQVSPRSEVTALQAIDRESIPSTLTRGGVGQEGSFFSVEGEGFIVDLDIKRHGLSDMLPARVERVLLTTSVSGSGEALTHTSLWMDPGEKQALRLKLPAAARFWFGFVNGEAALPWRDGDEILLPLSKQADPNQATLVEFFFTSAIVGRLGDFETTLQGPQFDLPLENITWQTYVPSDWRIDQWGSGWQLEPPQRVSSEEKKNIDYLSREANLLDNRTQEAEKLFALGNNFIQTGEQRQARRAYESAMELSRHDTALNEDIRVQLQNIKTQEALVGLNVARNNFSVLNTVEPINPLDQPLEQVQLEPGANYTQDQARKIMNINTQEDNAALVELAERLVRQQDAAQSRATSVRASIPDRGHRLSFTRALEADAWRPLTLTVSAGRQGSQNEGHPVLILVVAGIFFFGLRYCAGDAVTAKR